MGLFFNQIRQMKELEWRLQALESELVQLKMAQKTRDIQWQAQISDLKLQITEEAKNLIEQAQFQINDKAYQRDVEFVDIEMMMCEMRFPGNKTQWEAFRELHKGERCIIIGNGPSLHAEDLQRLHEKNICCFGSNRIHLIYPQTDWRPNYLMCLDSKVLEHSFEEISQVDFAGTWFFPCTAFTEGGHVAERNAVYFPFKYRNPFPIWFPNDPSRIIHEGMSVTYALIQLAYFMGFSNIYLLGVDHFYSTKIDENGRKVMDSDAQSHFTKDYLPPGSIENSPQLETVESAYHSALDFSRSHGFEIFNATRGGALEVFPRVSFDELLSQWE